MLTRFDGFCDGKREAYGDKFDASDLNQACVEHYNAGRLRRVKVSFAYGEEKWGVLGVTSGPKPIFILLRNRISRGSSDTIRTDDKIVGFKDLKK